METGHQDVIHDTQLNYYGQLLATGSSDRTVKIFDVANGAQSHVATLTGHDGPVWMVSWAHPRFGNIIASASYDGKAIVWSNNGSVYKPVHIVGSHTSSVNGISWAPQQFGLILATASSDGSVGITRCDGQWSETMKVGGNGVAHPMGAMAVSFLPHFAGAKAPIFASAGCDGHVRLWSLTAGWTALDNFQDHSEWVRDVAFSPVVSDSSYAMLASCAQDKRVVIRRKKVSAIEDGATWETSVTALEKGAWRLSWSPCGKMLLVTTQDSESVLLKEGAVFTDAWVPVPLGESQK